MDEALRFALARLDQRLKTLLPEEYQDTYQEVEPVSMGSAGLKYDAAGEVAWDQMWGSFCDLAMAGGPPHKGTLLGPGLAEDIDAQFLAFDAVAEEIGRGITLVTGLRAYVSPLPGWVRVVCLNETMAAWLLRAVVMENVAAHRQGHTLDVPAAPHFRLEKEIKNVITVIAKTCHYWLGHTPRLQQEAIAALLARLSQDAPLLEPALTPASAPARRLAERVAAAIRDETGVAAVPQQDAGWLGLACPDVRSAVWMMRALVAGNVLARRESTTLFVPIDPVMDADGRRVAGAFAEVRRLAAAAGVLR